jgi:DNA transformation protein
MARAVVRPSPFVAFLLEALAPLGAVSARRMFGGTGLFRGELMFALLTRDESLFFRVGDANRSAFEAAGQAPLSYETKHGTNTLRSYWSCPPELLDDTDTLREWARGAVGAALAGRARPARKR